LTAAMTRTEENGNILTRKLHAEMSNVFVQQDGARPHWTKLTKKWMEESNFQFWSQNTWLLNSHDLSPIENLWSILQNAVNNVDPPATNIKALKQAAH